VAYTIDPISTEDGEAILDIFNHYVENTFAAYPDTKLPCQAFGTLLALANGLPAGTLKDRNGRVVGFGMLRPHHPLPTFSRTAEVTCFLHPAYTGRGLGQTLLTFLENKAKESGIANILACISSLNPGSIHFHRKNGFVECGRFIKIGEKIGLVFDTVWMQKVV
jgi:phosphinothricin acetyltransferase